MDKKDIKKFIRRYTFAIFRSWNKDLWFDGSVFIF